ncbi:hypothetical protein [Mesorhizobium sp. J428]|uniref:hypothetical protein n=1 Tax=Mesorhizobium sp. J428 TaxID=2898440 RepID=UPI002151DBB3|nr:hypothetical protein [Mesorhizobium sp. J428]MCR5858271.1 hypothetical protein [Mesorhizobium sp. J428]
MSDSARTGHFEQFVSKLIVTQQEGRYSIPFEIQYDRGERLLFSRGVVIIDRPHSPDQQRIFVSGYCVPVEGHLCCTMYDHINAEAYIVNIDIPDFATRHFGTIRKERGTLQSIFQQGSTPARVCFR